MPDPQAAYVGRLAPSPTGALHLGNARTFLIAWLRCRSAGGRMILRLEDLDHPKVKPHTIREVYEDLAWLGLDWEEGPCESFAPQAGGMNPLDADDPYVQSHRFSLYREIFETLRREGRVYPCVCTRRDIEQAQSAPHPGEEMRYPGLCRDKYSDLDDARAASEREPAWRFRVDDSETFFDDAFRGPQRSRLAEWSGDFVVFRGDDKPAYQLAVVADDHAMGVTEVVRADDLLASTHRQIALYDALGWTPPRFLHVPLVVGPDGRRLAKRHGDTRLSAYREAGVAPETLIGWLAASCGWAEPGEAITAEKLLPRFDLSTIPSEPATLGDAIPG